MGDQYRYAERLGENPNLTLIYEGSTASKGRHGSSAWD